MSHQRPPQLHGSATLLDQQMLTPRITRLRFHAPALASLRIERPAHALHVWFSGDSGVDWHDKTTRRVFTLRQFDPARAELALDIVRHGSGLACRWAEQARPGDTITMAGPRSGYTWPVNCAWLLAIVDESALPALATIVEHACVTRPIHATVVLRHTDERGYLQDLQSKHPHLRVTYREPEDATLQPADWPQGPAAAFIAGESDWVASMRATLQGLCGVNWQAIHASGYWHKGQGAYQHG